MTLESLGASIGASGGNNALLIQAGGLTPDLSTIASVFGEVIATPSLPDDVIAREKASQLASLQESLQDPLHLCMIALRQAAFHGQGYGLSSLGTPDSLAALNREILSAHHARHFTGSNLTVAIAGDFDPSEARELLSAQLSIIHQGTPWTPPASCLQSGHEVRHYLPKKQAVMTMGYPGVSASSADRHALAFIQEYATDMAGPLFTRIREELGLAYQVGATQFLGYDQGLFTFYLATSPEQADLAREELLKEIQKIATQGIDHDAFERVRSTALSGLAIEQQSPSSAARHAALDLLFGHAVETHQQLPSIYQALTADQVRETAQRIFSVAPVIATVLPEA
jgi:zinc protease